MAVKLTFIATALLAIAALPMLPCAGASQPEAAALPQSAAATRGSSSPATAPSA